ncbi:MAG: hypothetical protein P1U36_03595 [Legionellaceae bacterium]|nr:hypothetical protein [Legionellaceae bacterium]
MPSPEQPLSFVRMKQDFFASKPRTAETTPGFLLHNERKIAEEHRHLKAILKNTNVQHSQKNYHDFVRYCEELLELHDQTIRHDFKKPMRDKIIFAHVARIMLSSARFIVLQSIELLDKAQYFGQTTNTSTMIELLLAPTPYFSVLSVAVPGLRLLTDLVNIAKHAIYPTETNKANEEHELSLRERFASELYRAGTSLINDALWVLINTLSSYPKAFGLTPPVAMALVLVGLMIDIGFLFYNYHIANKAYQEKKDQYEDEIDKNNQHPPYPGISKTMSERQLLELELSYCGTQSNLNLSLLAGSAILSGFALLMAAPLPILAPLGGLICLLGTSLYLTAGAYAHYEQQSFIYNNNKNLLNTPPSSLAASEKAKQEAWNNFVIPLITNVCFPVILIATLVVSSPAALLLLIGFITFKIQSPEPEPLIALTY